MTKVSNVVYMTKVINVAPRLTDAHINVQTIF